MSNDRRLIEDFIPIREISVEAAREKSIRKGHLSTLHLWWARRPLVAARAAVFASLVAAPESPQKRRALTDRMIELCQWGAGQETIAKARKQILEAQRDRRGIGIVDKPTQYYILGRYEYGEAAVEFDEANTLARGVGVELDGSGGLTDGKLALVKKVKTTVQLRDYSDRGADPDLGIQRTERQQTFNVKPKKIGAAPTLIDILHRLLWLAEHKPQEIANFLAIAQPDATQLRLVAQALAGRALTPEPGQENSISPRTREQAAIDTLLASWKRLVEDNLFTQSR